MAVSAAPHPPAVESAVSEEFLSAAPPSYWRLGARDLAEGLRLWPLWMRLGWEDIRQRYQRSFLGPFWISLSMLVMVTSLGVLYSKIFHQDLSIYFPFLTLGILFWQLMADLLREGCQSFLQNEGLIRQIRLPLCLHVYRFVFRQFAVLAHNIVIYLPVMAIFGVRPQPVMLLAIPGLALWVLNGVWLNLFLGMLSARFRDVPPLVASLVQIVFFMSPIMWQPTQLGTRAGAVELNPVYHFLELVRAPLSGQWPDSLSWPAALAITLVGWAVTFPFFARFRARVPFWL